MVISALRRHDAFAHTLTDTLALAPCLSHDIHCTDLLLYGAFMTNGDSLRPLTTLRTLSLPAPWLHSDGFAFLSSLPYVVFIELRHALRPAHNTQLQHTWLTRTTVI